MALTSQDSFHWKSVLIFVGFLIISRAHGCTSKSVQHKRTGDDVTLHFRAITNSAEYFVLNFILSPNGSQLLNAQYIDGDHISTSYIIGCRFIGNTRGNLSIRIDNLQASGVGTYKHAVYTIDNVLECVTVYMLGVPTKPIIYADKDPSVGESVTLTCRSTSTTIPSNHGLSLRYTWSVDNEVNPSGSKYTYSTDKKTLTLSDIVKEDADKDITCTTTENVTNGLSSTSSISLSLNVLYQEFYIEGNRDEEVVTVDEHDEIQFICVIDSNTTSPIQIMFENKILKEVSDAKAMAFTLRNAACFDGGVYTCEWSNGCGHPSNRTVLLLVRCSPRPLHQLTEKITSSLYLPVTLSVEVLAYPEPGPTGYTWYRKDGMRWIPLLRNADLHISSSGLQSNLTILNVSHTDYGQYRVTTVNGLGTYEQFLFLTENKEHTTMEQVNNNEHKEHATMEEVNNNGNKHTQTDNTVIFVGITLGFFSFVVVVYATVFIILLKAKSE